MVVMWIESCSDVESDASECMVGVESEAELYRCVSARGLHTNGAVPLIHTAGRSLIPFPMMLAIAGATPLLQRQGNSLQLGQYVCVHNRKLGNCHVVCRIVDVDGRCCRFYCSSGLLDKAFPGDELTLVASERTIPLDNWRQAGKVSMCSLASDMIHVDVQPCNCNLPPPPESIVIDSESDEAEQRPAEVWVTNELYSVTKGDEKCARSPSGWLTGEIIETAQLLVLQELPTMRGLQHISHQEVSSFDVLFGENHNSPGRERPLGLNVF